MLGQSLFFKGDRDGAMRELKAAYQMDHHHAFLAWMAYIQAVSGQRDSALAAVRKLQTSNDSAYMQPYFVALVSVGLGDKEKAFEWLSKSVDARAEEVVCLQVDPAMDPLRSDPRYTKLLKRVGFSP